MLTRLAATQSDLACAHGLVEAKTGPSRIAGPPFSSDTRCRWDFRNARSLSPTPTDVNDITSWVRSQSLFSDIGAYFGHLLDNLLAYEFRGAGQIERIRLP